VLVPPHRLIDKRLEAIQAAGVDVQIISFTTPGTLIETPQRSVELSRVVNDHFARIQSDHDCFPTLATLPLNAPEACLAEMERALDELGLKGVTLYSNANGVALSDKVFWPLYELANDRSTVFFIHPTFPVGVSAMEKYMLMPLVGFLTDTTLAAASLVFSGVVERFPNIRWVLGHLGGAVPYLAERFDRGYEAYPVSREHINKPPSEYLKQHFYYDTVNFDVRALQFAIDFAGVDHVVAGSDFPHLIGSMDKMLTSINALAISDSEKEAILSGNATRLLGL
jgi:aminocarboxymuconate-semialdehyde decarboxylase